MVPLKPLSTLSTMGAAVVSYTSRCKQSSPYVWSKVKARGPSSPCVMLISLRAELAFTTLRRPSAISRSLSGRMRTTTRTHSLQAGAKGGVPWAGQQQREREARGGGTRPAKCAQRRAAVRGLQSSAAPCHAGGAS
jgi:hypothetical protein